jgi:hypothetical protein
LGQIHRLTRRATRNLPEDEARELQEQADELEELVAYQAMSDEIEAAGEALEAHRAEFEEMMADAGSAMDGAQRLFSGERFASLRYTADDLERAFEAVGYPTQVGGELGEEDMKKVVAATVHLAGDEEQRFRLARRLLMTMPEYVDARRWRDAWLIQYSAFRLIEVSEEGSPFMLVMFQLAYAEWLRQRVDEQQALLKELGVDRSAVRNSGVADLYALARDLMKDPKKKARMEAFYEAHRAEHDGTEAWLLQLEDQAVRLLQRDDAGCILLSLEEVGPWLPVLMERLMPLFRQAQEAREAGREPDSHVQAEIGDTFVATIREMVPEIYTQERIDQLAADLQDYRRRLLEAGEEEAARWADGALLSLQRGDPPAENPFLGMTTYASVRAIIKEAAENSARAQETSEGGDA